MIQVAASPATRGSAASEIIAFLNANRIYADFDGRIRHNGLVVDLLFNHVGALTLCQVNGLNQPWKIAYQYLREPAK